MDIFNSFILFLMLCSTTAHGPPDPSDVATGATARAVPNQTAPSKVVWKAPLEGWKKMNVDGRNWSDDNSTTAGGVFRGSDGLWISGFAINLEKGKSQLEALIWGLYHGLRLARDKGFQRVKVEMDSAIAIHLIDQTEYHGHPLATLLSDCKELIDRDWEVEISLISKQQNMVANSLAEISRSRDLDLIVYDNPPYTTDHTIEHLLNVDRIGT